jgi:hypothetical protein
VAGGAAEVTATDDLIQARELWRPGLSVFAVHALRGNLGFPPPGPVASVAAGYGTTEGMVAQIVAFAWGGSGRPVRLRPVTDGRRQLRSSGKLSSRHSSAAESAPAARASSR